VGNFFGGNFWRKFFPPHTKFLQIVEYLRVGGIFKGKNFKISSKDFPGGQKRWRKIPLFPEPFRGIWYSLAEIFLTYSNLSINYSNLL